MVMHGRSTKANRFLCTLIIFTLFIPAANASTVNTQPPRVILATYEFLPDPDYTQNDEKALLRIVQYDMPLYQIIWKDPQGTQTSCGSVCVTNFEYSPGGVLIAATEEFYIAGRSLPSGTYTARVLACTYRIGVTCITWELWFEANFTISDVGYTISGNAGVAGATLSYFDGTEKTVNGDDGGNYLITVPPGWSGTVTPSKPHYTFTPPSITYSNVQESYSEQDYTATEIYVAFFPVITR